MTPGRGPREKERGATGAPGKPAIIDTLLQSATVAVLHACGVAAAPLAPVRLSAAELGLEFPVGLMRFKASHVDAALILSLPPAVCERLEFGRRQHPDVRDILRELTNLIVGRLKNRLTLYQVAVSSSLPLCRDRMAELDSVLPQAGTFTAYRFRTLGGTVLLALKGSIDESRLVYSSKIFINAEGDIILF